MLVLATSCDKFRELANAQRFLFYSLSSIDAPERRLYVLTALGEDSHDVLLSQGMTAQKQRPQLSYKSPESSIISDVSVTPIVSVAPLTSAVRPVMNMLSGSIDVIVHTTPGAPHDPSSLLTMVMQA
jgi:hypothetical protein